jgi:hypothetical protein
MEEKAKAAKEKEAEKAKLRGGTGAAGPLFQLPGEGGGEKKE